jgi:DNA-binding NarL/FixJ family response regulator
MNTEIISIAIVDDHTLFRNGVASLMSEYDNISIAFEASNGLEMQSMIKKNMPDIVLMDINMAVMGGFEATKWLKENYPRIHVLALTMFEDDYAILKMIRAGAKGYISKEATPADLLFAIRAIKTKGIFVNEFVSGKLLRSFHVDNAPEMTLKEIQFLELCCSELTYKEIADKMNVSPRTVDNYRESLFDKFHIKSRVGLVLYAIRNRIII